MAKYYVVLEELMVCNLKCRDRHFCRHLKSKKWEPVGTLYMGIGGARGYITQKTNFEKGYNKKYRHSRQICELDSDDFVPISLDDQEKYEKLENVMSRAAARAEAAKKSASKHD